MAVSADSLQRAGPVGVCPAALKVNEGIQVLGTEYIAAEEALDFGDYLYSMRHFYLRLMFNKLNFKRRVESEY